MPPCAACQLGILSTYRERKNGSYHRHTVPHTRVYLYIPHNTWCPRDTLQNQRSTAPVCAHVRCSRSQPRVMQGTIEAAPIQTTRTLRHIAPSPHTHSHPHHPSLGASAHRLLKSKSKTERTRAKGKREKGKKGNSKNFGKVYFYAPQNYCQVKTKIKSLTRWHNEGTLRASLPPPRWLPTAHHRHVICDMHPYTLSTPATPLTPPPMLPERAE
jgi:hypothetical protein